MTPLLFVACIEVILFYLALFLFVGTVLVGIICYFSYISLADVNWDVHVGNYVPLDISYYNHMPNAREIVFKIEKLNEMTNNWELVQDPVEWDCNWGQGFIDNGWSAGTAGYYRAKAYFQGNDKGLIPVTSSTREFVVCGVGNPAAPYEIEIWSGQNTKGNPLEVMTLPYAHLLSVAVIDPYTSEPPLENVDVFFHTDYGKFQSNYKKVDTVSSKIIWVGGNKYIRLAATILILDMKDPITNGGYVLHTVTASSEKAYNTARFSVYSIFDREQSHDIGNYTHQLDYPYNAYEVPGDNYLDDGYTGNYKNVNIELDWGLRESINQSVVNDIAGYIKEALQTGGIFVTVNVKNDSTKGLENVKTHQQRKAALYNSKDTITQDQRLWNNSIHVILGRTQSDFPNAKGILVDYSYIYTNLYWIWNTMHLASGPTEQSNKYLDSTGCFVFMDDIINFPGRKMEIPYAIALVAAHEIGHALGMAHYPLGGPVNENHFMYYDFTDILKDEYGWNKYKYFSKKTLKGDHDDYEAHWDGMNTRHVVGIQTVSFDEDTVFSF